MAFTSTFKKVYRATKDVAIESMKAAAEELIANETASEPFECSVSLDETWQRRGHASHHGVVTVISVKLANVLTWKFYPIFAKAVKKKWENKKGTPK